jgi:hypothetical protein
MEACRNSRPKIKKPQAAALKKNRQKETHTTHTIPNNVFFGIMELSVQPVSLSVIPKRL